MRRIEHIVGQGYLSGRGGHLTKHAKLFVD